MQYKISKNLQNIMNKAELSLTDLINLCIDLPPETIKNVYYGKTKSPTIDTLYKICNSLNISLDFITELKKYDEHELELLTNYRKSSSHGKAFLLTMADFEMEYTKFEDEQNKKYEVDCATIPESNKKEKLITCMEPTGKFRNGILFDTAIFTKIPTHLDNVFMAIKIPNDYLSPTYVKNDVVFMEKRNPEYGEIAMFQKGNYVFIRQFNYDAITKKFTLRSLNISNDDIIVDNLNNYTIKGTFVYLSRESTDSLKALSRQIKLDKKINNKKKKTNIK